MADFRCGRFPVGQAHIRTPGGELVTFVDGVARVDDPQTAEGLRAAPADFEVSEIEPPEKRYTLAEIAAEFGVDLRETEDSPPPPPSEPSGPELSPNPSTEAPTYEPDDVETVTVTAAEIRQWAKEADISCPAKGRIPQDVADAYLAAHN